MRYKVILITFLFILVGAQHAMAADRSRYRVEIIVLSHLQHDAVPEDQTRLRDYSAALDFLAPAAEDDGEAPGDRDDTAAAAGIGAAGDAPGTEESMDEPVDASAAGDEPAMDPWQEVAHLPEMGPEMQEAWRRLRLSGPFRPLQFLAWEQGGDAPFPSLRVHDLEVVHSEDPWFEERAALALVSQEQQDAGGDGPAYPGGPEDADSLPPPILHYQLDGTAMLRRSRFLHLALALELRTPVFDTTSPRAATPLGAPAAVPGNDPIDEPQLAPTSFLVHRLEQSRVVATGRMEYFDGPVLGVLAWITDISDGFAEAQAASTEAQP
jgi:hypothetical protein